MSETIKTTTLISLWERKTFTTISKLRMNQNGYPYITLLNGKKANNVYFGRKTSEIVTGTFKEGDDLVVNGFLADAQIVEVTNAQGETRFKLSKSMGDYSSAASLENAFGGSAQTEFDYNAFSSQFTEVVKVNEPEIA